MICAVTTAFLIAYRKAHRKTGRTAQGNIAMGGLR